MSFPFDTLKHLLIFFKDYTFHFPPQYQFFKIFITSQTSKGEWVARVNWEMKKINK